MQVLELQNRVEQLEAENRRLAETRAPTDRSLALADAGTLADRDALIDSLRQEVQNFRNEVERLREVNEGLRSAIDSTALQHNDRVRQLETEGLAAMATVRGQLDAKDAEIARLQAELAAAQDEIRRMRAEILASMPADGVDLLKLHDIDYFDRRCQKLCTHVQTWVLRFSKFSDMRACRQAAEINDEKIVDRLDNAVLDGSDVDDYLRDRVHRRDVFMAITMYMVWEFVFTRYLFGMNRDQRQKIKSLEKTLLDIGPIAAVRQWRAVTLTLLLRQASFRDQREQDTEAVVQAILQTLSTILPPPTNMEDQIEAQLRRVVREAVDLSIEMRCQRAEYMMLPPLQPAYDENGELVETVAYNPELMSERKAPKKEADPGEDGDGGEDTEADASRAGLPVRMVLFPLVVKTGDDSGQGDDKVVVHPAQVLLATPLPRRTAPGSRRMVTPSSDAGGVSLLSATQHGGAGSNAVGRHPNHSAISMTDAGSIAEAQYIEGGF